MRRLLLLAVSVAALPDLLGAQSSQFGVNGLGFPGRQVSARASATGGGFGFFDPASGLNPAALHEHGVLTASFTAVQNYRSSTIGSQSESGRDMRFPQLLIGGPVRGSRLALGASFSTYTDRDFAIASADTVLLRGVLVPVADTLTSGGGISDLGLNGAWRAPGWVFGVGLHIITGSTRNEVRRTFEDTAYAPVRDQAEVSYAGVGVSAGLMRALGRGLTASAVFRLDGDVSVERDSTRVGTVDLPIALGAGLRWRASPRIDLATQALTRRWGSADADLRALGGTGARNTIELSAGAELVRNPRRPQQRPLRLGARFATLPFPVESGAQPREFGLALGTGLRFAQDRAGLDHAGIDLSIERTWRSADGGFSEGAWLVGIGILVRP